MSAGYAIVYGAHDEADEKARAEALREETDEIRKTVGLAREQLDELVPKIAAAIATRREAHEEAVRKARRVDSERLDQIAADLAEIAETRNEWQLLGEAVRKLAAA